MLFLYNMFIKKDRRFPVFFLFVFFIFLFDGLKDLGALKNGIDLKTIIMNIASEAYRKKYTALMQTRINKKYHCANICIRKTINRFGARIARRITRFSERAWIIYRRGAAAPIVPHRADFRVHGSKKRGNNRSKARKVMGNIHCNPLISRFAFTRRA